MSSTSTTMPSTVARAVNRTRRAREARAFFSAVRTLDAIWGGRRVAGAGEGTAELMPYPAPAMYETPA